MAKAGNADRTTRGVKNTHDDSDEDYNFDD